MSKKLKTYLFPEVKPVPRERAKPRKLMHYIDRGESPEVGHDMACFECHRCGYESDWMSVPRKEIDRGIPCPQCVGEKIESD